jgi:hypothetical protein
MKRKTIGGTEYSKAQIRRLRRHICRLCEQRLTEERCGSMFAPPDMRCTPEIMAKKRAECLAAGRVRGP